MRKDRQSINVVVGCAYITKEGYIVEITHIDLSYGPYKFVGFISINGKLECMTWNQYGSAYPVPCKYDLVKELFKHLG